MNDPVFRRGAWWQRQDDGTWLRWNDASQAWERSESPPPPPEESHLPPAPPTPGGGIATPYPRTLVTSVPVPNYLVWAILVTLFCFLPTGIVAIVYASQVSTKLSAGDVAGATEASNKAKMWTIISAVAGVLIAVIVIAGTAGSNTPMLTP